MGRLMCNAEVLRAFKRSYNAQANRGGWLSAAWQNYWEWSRRVWHFVTGRIEYCAWKTLCCSAYRTKNYGDNNERRTDVRLAAGPTASVNRRWWSAVRSSQTPTPPDWRPPRDMTALSSPASPAERTASEPQFVPPPSPPLQSNVARSSRSDNSSGEWLTQWRKRRQARRQRIWQKLHRIQRTAAPSCSSSSIYSSSTV